MREIKFRGLAYSPSYKEFQWVYGDLNQMQTETVIHERAAMRTAYFVHEHTVGEYAGLKDENGVDIYEGDIVLFDSKVYPVAFKNGNFGVKKLMRINLYTDEMREYQEPLWNLVVDGCEVIGNIYENPELLGDNL